MRLRAVGEVQSPPTPPSYSNKNKTQALAQGGIHGVGQTATEGGPTKVPVILIYKDKSVQVLVASTTDDNISSYQYPMPYPPPW